MNKCSLSEIGVPALSTGNGNCLFNSVSTALTGDEELATELRLRTAIEMSLNFDFYKARDDFDQLMNHSPSIDESILAACTDGAYSSLCDGPINSDWCSDKNCIS